MTDQVTHVQHCTHCCHSGIDPGDSKEYVFKQRKEVCSLESPGVSNGICDGFGQCQCRPPFVGSDCSMGKNLSCSDVACS